MENKSKPELLLETFHRSVSAILGQTTDPETDLREIMSDSINGFGTGKHEIFDSYTEFKEKIFKVFGKQLPPGTKLHFIDIQSQVLDTVGIVHATYEINYALDGIENNYYGRRSTVFQWDNDRWRAIHLHVSEPSAHLAAGESFPVKALKAQNEELIKELNTEAEKGHLEEVKAIAKDITFNSEKINHHGKRAEAIVKGMLQHSRTVSGQKEPTDINALADEYLRLAYHGLRAKDKSFNAMFESDFDNSIGKLNIISQDIGRVILNLINNAFYAVGERKKHNQNGYEPTVSVSTKKNNGMVEIRVSDNGNGIPQKVLNKIFQPFFTTKTTGQGTGLGLSLSYDIVKAHNGELKVATNEGEGSEFIIFLPANN